MTTKLLECTFTNAACSANYMGFQSVHRDEPLKMYQRRPLVQSEDFSIWHSIAERFLEEP